MKEAKKAAQEGSASRSMVIKQAWIDREKASGEARRLLHELEDWLSEHSEALKMRTIRCTSLSAAGKQLVANANMRCIETSEEVLAAQLLAGKTLSKVIFDEQNSSGMKKLYTSINFSRGPNMAGEEEDLATYRDWDVERAAVQILKTAILLQKKNTAAATKVSMERFSRTVNQVRGETAREFLAVLLDMRRIAEPDQALATGLDEDEIEGLRPKPFPQRILSSEAISWFLDAAAEKIIETDELGGLQLEKVSPEKVKAEPAESWLAQV